MQVYTVYKEIFYNLYLQIHEIGYSVFLRGFGILFCYIKYTLQSLTDINEDLHEFCSFLI